MSLRPNFTAAAGQWEKARNTIEGRVARAATAAAREAGSKLLQNGRAAIASGGFGPKWTNTFRVEVYPKSGNAIAPAILGHHRIPYAGVFQTGAEIVPKKGGWLWIPLGNVRGRFGGRKLTPASYITNVGPLHLVVMRGKPFLAAYMRGRRRPARGHTISTASLRAGAAFARLGVRARRGAYGTAGVISVPIFIGVRSVHLRKKFDLVPVFNQAQQDLNQGYYQRIKANVG